MTYNNKDENYTVWHQKKKMKQLRVSQACNASYVEISGRRTRSKMLARSIEQYQGQLLVASYTFNFVSKYKV